MENVKPVYLKLLAAAAVIYVVGTAMLISDLCYKVGELEFKVMHIAGECHGKHSK